MRQLLVLLRGSRLWDTKSVAGSQKRTILLVGVTLILGVFLLIDQGFWPNHQVARPKNSQATSGKALNESPSESLQNLQEIVRRRQEIIKQYQRIGVPYAEAMGALIGFVSTGQINETEIRNALLQSLPEAVELNEVVVGQGVAGKGGSQVLPITLSITSRNSQALTSALLMLGNPANGSLWQEFNLKSDPQQRLIGMEGTLMLLALSPAE